MVNQFFWRTLEHNGRPFDGQSILVLHKNGVVDATVTYDGDKLVLERHGVALGIRILAWMPEPDPLGREAIEIMS